MIYVAILFYVESNGWKPTMTKSRISAIASMGVAGSSIFEKSVFLLFNKRGNRRLFNNLASVFSQIEQSTAALASQAHSHLLCRMAAPCTDNRCAIHRHTGIEVHTRTYCNTRLHNPRQALD